MNIYQPNKNELTSIELTQIQRAPEKRKLSTENSTSNILFNTIKDIKEAGVHFSDIATASYDYGLRIINQYGRTKTINDLVDPQYQLLKEKNLIPDFHSKSVSGALDRGENINDIINQDYYTEDAEGFYKYLRDNPEKVTELQQKYPQYGIKSPDQIDQDALNDFNEYNQKFIDSQRDNTVLGTVATFLGIAAGSMNSPEGWASLTIPVGGAYKAGTSLLKTMAVVGASSAAITAGLESVNKPGEVALRETLGEEISPDQALEESALTTAVAGAAGAVLGGLGYGVGAALSKRRTNLWAKQILDAKPEYLSDSEYAQVIDQALDNVVKDQPINLSNVDFIKATQESADQFRADVLNDLERDFTPVDLRNIEVAPKVPGESESLTPEFTTLREQLKGNDLEVAVLDENGKVIEKSAYNVALELEKDAKTFKLLQQCLAG